jgi:hypothetical protein
MKKLILIALIFAGCKKEAKQTPQTASTSHQLVCTTTAITGNWLLEINGIGQSSISNPIQVNSGDHIRWVSRGVYSFNPSTGVGSYGYMTCNLTLDGNSIYSYSCNCQTEFNYDVQ